MTTYTLAWVLWWAAFFIIEGKALADKKPGGTLSEHLWDWFSVNEKGRAWRLRRILMIGILAWLCLHFILGGAFV